MEWVEVRGETIAEAEELALDQLGVAREDAEFEIVQSPESRWLGLKRVEARVRARVRPTAPPPKVERGGRGRRRQKSESGAGSGTRANGSAASRSGRSGSGRAKGEGGSGTTSKAGSDKRRGDGREGNGGRSEARGEREANAPETGSGTGARKGRERDGSSKNNKEQSVSSEERELVSVDEQQQVVGDFLNGVVTAFGLDASVSVSLDEETVVGSVDGSGVGLLIGPEGGTLRALQELARTSMQRHAQGRDTNRLVIDVGGYRERRRAALEQFTRAQSEKVLSTGDSVAFEPMSSSDRKIVHDVAAEIDGVTTSSADTADNRGRYVILSPA